MVMKLVRFENKSQKTILGRLTPEIAIARQINAEDTAYLWWQAPTANQNFPTDALPDTGLHANTRVAIPGGVAALKDLSKGDRVIDHQGQVTRITAIAPAGRTRKALRLRAPYFGLDQDIVIGSKQCLWMTSDRAEQMFGAESVLMPGWALKDQRRVHYVELSARDILLEVKLKSGNALLIGTCAVASKPAAGQSPDVYALSESEARGFSSYYRAGFFTT